MSVKSYALTTRQRLMDFMGIDSVSTAEGNVLDRIIDIVTEFVENYCQRRFKKTTYTQEEYDGTGTKYLVLKNYPVDSSATFKLEERTSIDREDDWDEVDSEDYFVHWDEGIIEFVKGWEFREYPRAWRVTYTAGFDFDNSSTFLSDTEAGDVEYVVWRLAATIWNNRKGDIGVESERLGDYSVTFRKELLENPELKAILDKYARLD